MVTAYLLLLIGIAVDWINDKIYWTDSLTKLIEVSDLDGYNRSALVWSDMELPRPIVLDPFNRSVSILSNITVGNALSCFLSQCRRLRYILTARPYVRADKLNYIQSQTTCVHVVYNYSWFAFTLWLGRLK